MPKFFSVWRKKLFALLLLLSFMQVGFAIIAAALLDKVFASFGQPTPINAQAGVQIGLSFAAIGLCEFGRRWTTEALGLDFAQAVRLALYERHLRKPFRGAKERSRGNVLLPFVGDLTALRTWWADGVARGSSAIFIAASLCFYLLMTEAALGLAMIALCLGSVALIALCSRPYARATQQQRQARGVMTGLISDRIAAAHTVYALGGLQREINLVKAKIGTMNSASLQRARWSGGMRAIAAVAPLSGTFFALMVVGSVTSTDATSGQGVVGSLLFVGLLGACIADVVRANELAIPGRIAHKRIEGRLSEIAPLRVGGASKTMAVSDKIGIPLAIRNLREIGWSKGFSTEAVDGEVILIESQFGPGVMTILSLVAGIQRPLRGQVKVLGYAAHRLPQKVRREAVGFASRATPLLQSSLANNLLYRLRDPARQTKVIELMKVTGLGDFVTDQDIIGRKMVRDGGADWPQAELDAIKLVRAMAGTPRVLVLDDVLDRLAEPAVEQLVNILSNWPGLVVLATSRAEFRAIASRRWLLSENGVTEFTAATEGKGNIITLFDGQEQAK